MKRLKVLLDDGLAQELDEYIASKYGGDPRGVRSRVIRDAIREYLRGEIHTHTKEGPNGPPLYTPRVDPSPVKVSRTEKAARALYNELKEKEMVGDPVRNVGVILRMIAQRRGSHPDTIQKYFFLVLRYRAEDKDLPPFNPPPPAAVKKLIDRTRRAIML